MDDNAERRAVIEFIREFHERNGSVPSVKTILKHLKISPRRFYERLFPGGLSQACEEAGVKPPIDRIEDMRLAVEIGEAKASLRQEASQAVIQQQLAELTLEQQKRLLGAAHLEVMSVEDFVDKLLDEHAELRRLGISIKDCHVIFDFIKRCLSKDLDLTVDNLADTVAKVARGELKSEELDMIISEKQKEVECLNHEIKALKNKRNLLIKENESLKLERTKLKEEISSIEEQRRLKKERLNEEISRMEEEITSIKRETEERKKRCEEEITSIERELEEKKRQLKEEMALIEKEREERRREYEMELKQHQAIVSFFTDREATTDLVFDYLRLLVNEAEKYRQYDAPIPQDLSDEVLNALRNLIERKLNAYPRRIVRLITSESIVNYLKEKVLRLQTMAQAVTRSSSP